MQRSLNNVSSKEKKQFLVTKTPSAFLGPIVYLYVSGCDISLEMGMNTHPPPLPPVPPVLGRETNSRLQIKDIKWENKSLGQPNNSPCKGTLLREKLGVGWGDKTNKQAKQKTQEFL